jgi:hypothetical protein
MITTILVGFLAGAAGAVSIFVLPGFIEEIKYFLQYRRYLKQCRISVAQKKSEQDLSIKINGDSPDDPRFTKEPLSAQDPVLNLTNPKNNEILGAIAGMFEQEFQK